MFELFGFKYGIFKDVDYVFDVCFLFNFYWEFDFKYLIGLDVLVEVFLGL